VNTWRQTIVAAVIMGLIAAALVWYLERFQTELIVEKFRKEIDEWKGTIGGEIE